MCVLVRKRKLAPRLVAHIGRERATTHQKGESLFLKEKKYGERAPNTQLQI